MLAVIGSLYNNKNLFVKIYLFMHDVETVELFTPNSDNSVTKKIKREIII